MLNRGLRWLLMYLLARFLVFRTLALVLSRVTSPSPVSELVSTAESAFTDLDIEATVAALKADGFAPGIHIPRQLLDEILRFAMSEPCYDDGDVEADFLYSEKETFQAQQQREIILAKYYNVTAQPVIQRLVNDPKLVTIARQFLGCQPLNSENRLWWSFANPVPEQERFKYAQSFHFDIEDYRCVRFFFYLTDVGEMDGPHICIRGSHRQKKLSYLWSLRRRKDEKDVINYYGNQNLVLLKGQAGYGFAEDPLCIHKGLTPLAHDRLILQVQYSMNSYGLGADDRLPEILKATSLAVTETADSIIPGP